MLKMNMRPTARMYCIVIFLPLWILSLEGNTRDTLIIIPLFAMGITHQPDLMKEEIIQNFDEKIKKYLSMCNHVFEANVLE